MSKVVHLYDPDTPDDQTMIRTYCGYQKRKTEDTYLATRNKDEVTCSKCLDKIDNPIRALRSYGNLHIGKLHLSIYPHPYHTVFVSVQSYDQLHWDGIVYNSKNAVKVNCEASTKQKLANIILDVIENGFLRKESK